MSRRRSSRKRSSPVWAGPWKARRAWRPSLLPDLDLNGQFNLLTSTSFDRPQDLFSAYGEMPRGVAFLSLVAPGEGGEWRMRGTITQGDLSSWIVSGSFMRKTEAAHAYEAGVSYAMQRYFGGNAEALVALRDGSRNVGTLYAYDNWTVSPRLQLSYGARYSDYDYLDDQRLFSPRAGIVVQPVPTDPTFRLRADVSRSESAPGAVEFLPPVGGVWLPPERTFSSLGDRRFVPQRVDHVEAGIEQDIGAVIVSARAFRQQTTDQVVSVFGAQPAASRTGHYYVGSAGDFQALGWGVAAESWLGAAYPRVPRLSAGLVRHGSGVFVRPSSPCRCRTRSTGVTTAFRACRPRSRASSRPPKPGCSSSTS